MKAISFVVEVKGHFKLPETWNEEYQNSLSIISCLLCWCISFTINIRMFSFSLYIPPRLSKLTISQTLQNLAKMVSCGGIFEYFSTLCMDLLYSCIQEFSSWCYQPEFKVTRGQYLKILQIWNLIVGIEASYSWSVGASHWVQDPMLCLVGVCLATKEWLVCCYVIVLYKQGVGYLVVTIKTLV